MKNPIRPSKFCETIPVRKTDQLGPHSSFINFSFTAMFLQGNWLFWNSGDILILVAGSKAIFLPNNHCQYSGLFWAPFRETFSRGNQNVQKWQYQLKRINAGKQRVKILSLMHNIVAYRSIIFLVHLRCQKNEWKILINILKINNSAKILKLSIKGHFYRTRFETGQLIMQVVHLWTVSREVTIGSNILTQLNLRWLVPEWYSVDFIEM